MYPLYICQICDYLGMWDKSGIYEGLLLAESSPWALTNHGQQIVHCSKLEPYIYWGLVVIFATHQLHINKNDLAFSR